MCKSKRVLSRITAAAMVLIMTVTGVGFGAAGTAYADEQLQSATKSDVMKSIQNVINSVNDLQGIMDDTEKSTIVQIFEGFTGMASTTLSVFSMVNTSVAFFKLIGVMNDGNATALANIQKQLDNISKKIDTMDKKLDDISNQMMVMQATNEVNARGMKACQMMGEWHQFEHDYMEEKMDKLINQHESMMYNAVKDWMENDTQRPSVDTKVNLNKVVVWYNDGIPIDPNRQTRLIPTAMNNIEPDMDRPKTGADPFTIYGNDDDFNPSFDRFIILDSTFMPKEGEVRWNVNTYRTQLVDFFKTKLDDVCDAEGNVKEEYVGHYKAYSRKDDYDIKGMTEEQRAELADDMADAIIYRIDYVKVNESAEFSNTVLKEYGEFCKHLLTPQQGIDARLKSIYLTHAFEYEVRDEITQFCDQMILKTGVYSMFAMDILGMSEFVKDTDKEDTVTVMCDTVDNLAQMKKNGITGYDRYCYVTNSVLNYAEVKMSGNMEVQYYLRGAVAGYSSYDKGNINIEYKSDEALGSSPAYVGDANALVIAYLLRQNGQVMDHDYLNKTFGDNKRTKHNAMITSLKGEQSGNTDANISMKTHRIIGGYFADDPVIRPSNLPKKATSDYLRGFRTITGTVVNGTTLAMQQNKALYGIAAYGESHVLWEVDESALMGGPQDDSTYKENFSTKCIDAGFFTDTYKAYYNNSVEYNCLISISKHLLYEEPGPYPVNEFKELTDELNERVAAYDGLAQAVSEAEELMKAKGWTSANLSKFKKQVASSKEYLDNDKLSTKEVQIEKDRLEEATEYYRSILKKEQNMTVKAKKKTLKAGALAKSKKVIKVITVKGKKGTVRYKKLKVTKSKFSKYFAVNKKNGKITVKKDLKKGTYKVTVRVKASGNSSYMPKTEKVTVTIVVK